MVDPTIIVHVADALGDLLRFQLRGRIDLPSAPSRLLTVEEGRLYLAWSVVASPKRAIEAQLKSGVLQ